METKNRLPNFEEMTATLARASCEVAKASREMTEMDHNCLREMFDEIYRGLKSRRYIMRPGLKLATVMFVRKTCVSVMLHYSCFEDMKGFTSVSSHGNIAQWVKTISKKSGLSFKEIVEDKKLVGIELYF